MGADVMSLPPGFVLEEDATGLPPGFVLDRRASPPETPLQQAPEPSFYDRLRGGLTTGIENLGSAATDIFTDPLATVRGASRMGQTVLAQPSTTAMPAELGAGAMRSFAGLADMAVPGNPVTEAMTPYGIQGGYMPPGLARDAVRLTGEYGIPAILGGVPVAGRNVATVPGAAAEFVGIGSTPAPVLPAANTVVDVLNTPAPGKTKAEITAALMEGAPNANTAGYRLETDMVAGGVPKLVKDAPAQAVLKTGVEPRIVALMDASDPVTLRQMEKMLNLTDNFIVDASVKGRALDVAGESIINRYKVLDVANRMAGKMVARAAEKLTGTVDMTPVVNNFARDLSKAGVTVTGDGLDFSASIFSKLPTTQKVLSNIFEDLITNPQMPAKKAHFFKRAITKSAQFGANVEGVDSDAVSLIRGVRANVNDALGKVSSEYANANKHYANTISGLEQLTDAAGVKVDFDSPTATRAAGTVASRILTNYASGANVDNALNTITDLSRQYIAGVPGFDSKMLRRASRVNPEDLADDLYNQAKFAIYLEQKIGSNATRSLTGIQQGVAAKASEDLALGGLGPVNVTRTVVEAGKRALAKDYRDQIKSMRDLLRQRRGNK